MKYLLLAVVAALFTAFTAQENPLDFSCAAFPANLTEADLVARYGRENVANTMIAGADDAPFPGTALFPSRADMRIDIAWFDPETKAAPMWIRIQGESSRWQTPNGLKLGDDLLSVERRNGWPFRLGSFGVEGQGIVRSWGRGRIRDIDSERCAVRVSFQPQWDGTEDAQWMRQVTHGREFSSGHPAMQGINPHVRAILLNYSLR